MEFFDDAAHSASTPLPGASTAPSPPLQVDDGVAASILFVSFFTSRTYQPTAQFFTMLSHGISFARLLLLIDAEAFFIDAAVAALLRCRISQRIL